MIDRPCLGCGQSLEGRDPRTLYCSNACRRWVANGHVEPRKPASETCLHCGARLDAGKLVTAVYCSRQCKAAASEQRRPPRNDAARYLREREHRIAAAKAYYKRRPEVAQTTKAKRKALMRGAGLFVVRPADWTRLCTRFDLRCFYCGKRRPLTMDHVIPVSRGGAHSLGNLIPACLSCNASKNDRTIMEWRVARRRWGGDSHPLDTIKAG